jgi:RNA polymerase sigma factor (sigma-70 family)
MDMEYEKPGKDTGQLTDPYFPSAEVLALSFGPEDITRLYLREIGHLTLLPEAEEQELVRLAHRGDEAARDRLLEHNLLRVVSIAREYTGRGMCALDLIHDGNEALVEAERTYDPDSIYPFAAYASWKIRQNMANNLKNHTCLRQVPKIPMLVPEPLDKDLIQNPAMLRWLLEKHNNCGMSEGDWMILAARFCPCGHRALSQKELSAMMGITREAVREAEYRTVRGRRILRGKRIRDFYT